MSIEVETFGLQQSDILSDGTAFDGADIPDTLTNTASIKAVTDAISILTESGGTVASDGTEQTVYINNAPSGIYEPKCIKIDLTANTAGETIVLCTYYRIKSGGGLIKQTEATYAGVQDPALISINLDENRYGVKVTLERTAGNAKNYDWEVIYGV